MDDQPSLGEIILLSILIDILKGKTAHESAASLCSVMFDRPYCEVMKEMENHP